jgi:hypothetical protein
MTAKKVTVRKDVASGKNARVSKAAHSKPKELRFEMRAEYLERG